MNPRLSLGTLQTEQVASVVDTGGWNLWSPSNIVPPRLVLDEVLQQIGPLPREALFMGLAADGLPVLLNLNDPRPGPLLVIGEAGTGKTDLLRLAAQFVIATHTPGEIQFAVLTGQVEEWQRLADASHCVGIFSGESSEARCLVHSLDAWISRTAQAAQSVLLLVDGLEAVTRWQVSSALRRILAHGAEKRVWPIVTTGPCIDPHSAGWLEMFRTRILAKGFDEAMNPLFAMKEQGEWLPFQVPSLGF